MKQGIFLITVFAVIGIIIMSGCIGEKGKEPVTPAPQPQQHAVKELTAGEIVEKTKAAVSNIKTYEADSKHIVMIGGIPEEENITCEVDRENKKKYGFSSYVEITTGEEILIETETYVIWNVAYTNAAGAQWFKSETDWAVEDVLFGINDLLINASLKGTESVDRKYAYVLELAADKSVFNEKFIALGGEDFEEMINKSGNINLKLWVDKETFLPLKEQRTADTKLKGDFVKIEIENNFKNYNAPQNIQLPEKAKSAEDASAEEVIQNPERVNKTISAIDKVTSYKLYINKNVTGPYPAEETHEVECDRGNKKMINVNTFSVSGTEAQLTTFVIDNMNYYEYSGAWFKTDTKWENEDFISVIKNLLEKTKVEVNEEGETLIFDIKTNKDIFNTDFGEIANEAYNSELATNELNSNAQNVVVKLWVSKDTFLPVKEVMSVESKMGSSKITIGKELSFTDYNKPFIITLPSGAENAELL